LDPLVCGIWEEEMGHPLDLDRFGVSYPFPAVPLLRYLQPPLLFEGKYLVGSGGVVTSGQPEPTARSSGGHAPRAGCTGS
jgi:hypothetical protein